jgi:WbqC-like protein family
MTRKVAIIQSNYIPWKGYFNIIKDVDEFVLLDDVQYTRRDWRNRNIIKTKHGLKWLTIPVDVKGKFDTKICEVETFGTDWRLQHWNMLSEAYKEAPFFNLYKEAFRPLFIDDQERRLSIINHKLITKINDLLGIKTPIRWSSDFDTPNDKTSRLVYICKSLKADVYISGSAAKAYLDIDEFSKNNIQVKWVNYEGYNEYPQLYPPFVHGVTILDLLFNQGEKSKDFLKNSI